MHATENGLALVLTGVDLTLAGPVAAALPATVTAELIGDPYALRLRLVWICAGIAAAVYAVMVHGVVAARRPRTRPAGVPTPGAWAELLWAVLPAILVVAFASPAVEALAHLAAPAQAGAERTATAPSPEPGPN